MEESSWFAAANNSGTHGDPQNSSKAGSLFTNTLLNRNPGLQNFPAPSPFPSFSGRLSDLVPPPRGQLGPLSGHPTAPRDSLANSGNSSPLSSAPPSPAASQNSTPPNSATVTAPSISPNTAPVYPAAVPQSSAATSAGRPIRERKPTIGWLECDLNPNNKRTANSDLSTLHPSAKRARTVTAPQMTAARATTRRASTRTTRNDISTSKKGEASVNKKSAAKGKSPATPSSVLKSSGKVMAPKTAASKKRARNTVEDDGAAKKLHRHDDEEGRAPKKARVTKAVKTPKPKVVISQVPTQKLDVLVCGEGSSGELGLGNAKNAIDVKRPRVNHHLSPNTVGVVHVAVGGMHSAALTHDNLIYTWGVNDQGALGRDTKWDRPADGSEDEDDTVDLNPKESTPMPIPRESFPSDVVFTQLACGDSTTFALTDDGDVWGWGTFRSNEGIMGFTKDVKIQYTPAKLPKLEKIKQIVCGANHAIALAENGSAWIWGSGEQQQLGYRILERKRFDTLTPSPLRLHKKVRLIGCGQDHSFAVDRNENVWTWGLNSFGQTGIREGAGGNQAVIFSPTRVPAIALTNGDTINGITGGAHHSAATSANGNLFVWGRLDGSQVGLDTTTLPNADLIQDSINRPRILIRPTEVPVATVGTAKMVAAGTDHTISINEAGQAHSWGFNVNYQCGQGGNHDEIDSPTLIANSAVKDKALNWAGAGGQFSVLTALAENAEEEL